LLVEKLTSVVGVSVLVSEINRVTDDPFCWTIS